MSIIQLYDRDLLPDGKCEYFITCDNPFIRTIKHNEQVLKHIIGSIKLINPVDFIGKELESDINE